MAPKLQQQNEEVGACSQRRAEGPGGPRRLSGTSSKTRRCSSAVAYGSLPLTPVFPAALFLSRLHLFSCVHSTAGMIPSTCPSCCKFSQRSSTARCGNRCSASCSSARRRCQLRRKSRTKQYAHTHTHTHAVYNTPDAPFLVQAAKETLELIAAVCTFVQGVLCVDKPPLHATALLDTLGVLHGRRKKLTEEANLAFKFNY